MFAALSLFAAGPLAAQEATPPAKNREQIISNLEKQIEALRKEIEALRKEADSSQQAAAPDGAIPADWLK